MFYHKGAREPIEDASMTFEELRIRKSEYFADLEGGKNVTWSVEYCGIIKQVKDPKPCWRGTAEFVSKYFTKGRMVVVRGRLQMRDWTDREGNKRVSAEIVADGVYFGDSKAKANWNAGNDDPSASAFDPDVGGDVPDGFTPNFEDTDGELPF